MHLPATVRALFLTAALGAAPTSPAAPPPVAAYDHYAIGDSVAATPARIEPGLLLLGGGDWPVAAFRWFAERAGHGHLVALAASGDDDLQKEIYRDVGGFASVETIVFHDRSAASDPRVLALVRQADAIFIRGGDQSNYIRYWRDTPLLALLNAHVRAGRPIGGTSAGLAILGAFSYGAMDGGSLESKVALADPFGPAVTLERSFLHLPFLEHVITDSHFAKRHRQGRLITFVARLAVEERDATITGLGIDENAGLCIDADGNGHFFTRDGGFAWLVRPEAPAERVVAGRPLTFHHVSIVGIGPDSGLDLRTLRVAAPAFEATADVSDGALRMRGAPPDPARP